MSRRKPYQKKEFESSGVSSDTSANIFASMMTSDAWMTLTASQKLLYVYCKAQYFGEKRKPKLLEGVSGLEDKSPDLIFTMNKAKWCGLYGLYKGNNDKGFIRDMSALIDKGFVRCLIDGAVNRTRSVYEYSSMWRKYGTNEFKVELREKTSAMRGVRKRLKE